MLFWCRSGKHRSVGMLEITKYALLQRGAVVYEDSVGALAVGRGCPRVRFYYSLQFLIFSSIATRATLAALLLRYSYYGCPSVLPSLRGAPLQLLVAAVALRPGSTTPGPRRVPGMRW